MTHENSLRIGIGYLLQETNTFSPISTRMEDFGLLFGPDILECWSGTRTEIAGFIDVLREVDLVPLFSGWAITAGRIRGEEFERIRSAISDAVDSAGRLDGLLLALHGAMCAEGTDDCEGVLLETIRETVPSQVPLVLTLDLHANLTQTMRTQASAILGYKTYPHVDMYETGAAAAQLLLGITSGRIRPVIAMRKIPLIVPPENSQTTVGPLAEVFRQGENFRHANSSILSVSCFPVQPWLDVSEMGCATLTVANRDDHLAQACADEMARALWGRKEEFEVELFSPEKAVQMALAAEGQPVVLSECSDSTGSGSPGDSADLVRALLALTPEIPAAVWVRDPEAAAKAWALGTGELYRGTIGGKLDPEHRQPVSLKGAIRFLSEGCFTFKGAFNTGMRADMGPTAVIRVGAIQIVVSKNSVMTVDPELYRSQGIEPLNQKIVVVKSPNGFRSQYESLATKIILVDTRGVSSPNLRSSPYPHVPRPIYPLDTFDWEP